jgi:hypothetical protein
MTVNVNNDSILDSTKHLLGLDPGVEVFDTDVITHLNSAFGVLRQLGVGPVDGFVVSDSTLTWVDFTSEMDRLQSVRSFVYTTVRVLFDPPATSFGISALTEVNRELAWRLNVEGEAINPPTPPVDTELPDWGFQPKPVNLGYMPVVTPDMADGNVFYLTLYGDCMINAPVNGLDGSHMTMELTSAGFTVTWGAGWNWGTYGQPVLTPAGTDIISAVFRETYGEWHAGWTPGF